MSEQTPSRRTADLAEIGRRIANGEIRFPDAHPSYMESLQMLPEAERRELLLGDWSAFEDDSVIPYGRSRRPRPPREFKLLDPGAWARVLRNPHERGRYAAELERQATRMSLMDSERLAAQALAMALARIDELEAENTMIRLDRGYSTDNSPALGGQKEER